MGKKSSCGVWCWMLYATPCLLLLAWVASGHLPGEQFRPLLWIYGFPSTALLLPVISLFWTVNGPADWVLVASVAAIANGGLLCGLLHLARNALRDSNAAPGESLTANRPDHHG